jgi:hypothetical protein
VLTALSPPSAVALGPTFTLTITGTGFLSGTVALWNAGPRPTVVVNPTRLLVTVPASDIVSGGLAIVQARYGLAADSVSDSLPFNISKASQTIAFAPLPDRTIRDAPFVVTATATSGLPVAFRASGNCTINDATVTLTGAGSCTITASQSGNGSYAAAPNVERSFTIGNGVWVVSIPALQINRGQ